ncbi:hypothetical protein P6144_05170 [Sphingomonas sp. HITSZ_GF]|uniref:hypothetical protein n=1 Tax=Sphingomonas sp. HITSZ_GF TaxID=3037247 RepID=UPI00240CE7FF|nr:hypothetical protein [Sphingomonas sp. HITSZ_GF]MDG2533027.1 hypothetical protein [Sphingomonas sp. HITSZ_GF]
MPADTTILDQVQGLIARLSPQTICDECLAEKLGLAWTSQANQAARQLVGAQGFERRSDICALCCAPRVVTRRLAR